MALQLKNKVKEEKPESEKKKGGKYKRKRNVFGKRTTRFGLYGLIIGLVAIFAIVKVVCTINQNNKQKKIEKKLADTNALIDETRRQLAKNQDSYDNVGKLISTLPATYDKQAISIDLNRILVLSGLEESLTTTRTIKPVDSSPIECKVDTIKPVEITMLLYGELDHPENLLSFVDYLTQYTHEYFYYIDSLDYKEDRTVYHKSEIRIVMYTFYNDVTLQPVVPSNNTTTA